MEHKILLREQAQTPRELFARRSGDAVMVGAAFHIAEIVSVHPYRKIRNVAPQDRCGLAGDLTPARQITVDRGSRQHAADLRSKPRIAQPFPRAAPPQQLHITRRSARNGANRKIVDLRRERQKRVPLRHALPVNVTKARKKAVEVSFKRFPPSTDDRRGHVPIRAVKEHAAFTVEAPAGQQARAV